MRKLLFISFLLFTTYCFGQQSELSSNNDKNKIGFISGVGNVKIGPLVSTNKGYYYKATFYELQWYQQLLKKKNTTIDLLIQPQYNLTKFKYLDTDPISSGYEFGLNFGFIYRKTYNKFSLYGLITTGPHYISGAPIRQSKGFIFSDNFNIGLNYNIHKNLFFDFRPGFRHISSAYITHPNGGINLITFCAGIFITY